MITLNEKQHQALFRNQTGDPWVGGIHMMNKFYEYVPFTLDGKQYVMEFLYPQYLNGSGFYSDLLFKTKDAGFFMPKRDHRILTIRCLEDAGNMTVLCNVQVSQTEKLALTLYQVILAYYQQNPQANQYFYEIGPELGSFIRNNGQPLAEQSGLTMMFHDELEEPFYGFSIFKDLTA